MKKNSVMNIMILNMIEREFWEWLRKEIENIRMNVSFMLRYVHFKVLMENSLRLEELFKGMKLLNKLEMLKRICKDRLKEL